MLREALGLGLVVGVACTCFSCSEAASSAPNTAQAGGSVGQEGRELPPTARPEMLADLRAAQAAPRAASDGGGRAWIELEEDETSTVKAFERSRWTIVYEAGPFGIEVGGLLRLTVPRFWDWTSAQLSSPEAAGFTTAATDAEGVTLKGFYVPEFWVEWRIEGRELREGEEVRIVYGAGPALARADRYAEHGSRFWISVDGDGDGVARVLDDSPSIDVEAGPPARLNLIVPSTAEPGETFRVHLAVLDAIGNMGPEYVGNIQLVSVPAGLELRGGVELGPDDEARKTFEARAVEPGVYRLVASATLGEGEIVGQSNPLLVDEKAAPIRWGDLHGHSNISDGTGTPDDYFTYARDVAGLDVIALTDHDHWGMLFLDEHPDIWRRIQFAAERFHEPGRFVTVHGYEWTNWIYGHRHVLYFEEGGEVLSSILPEYETPALLWEALRGKPALTFAHHSAGGPVAVDWSFAPDPELEPVTEITSVHGSSEAMDSPLVIYRPLRGNFVRDVLDEGHVLGFIGSGDSHDGHPGLAQIASPNGSGVAALLTSDLTREGVRAALKERRTYATNGPRIILRAALDGHGMGSRIPAAELGESATLYLRAIGTEPLQAVEVVRSGKLVAEVEAKGLGDLETTLELEDLGPGEYVYIRVLQSGDGAAWSSPFFVF